MKAWEESSGFADVMKALEESRRFADLYKDITSEISMATDALRISEREKEQFFSATRSIADEFQYTQDFINEQLSSFTNTAQLIQDDYEKLRMLINPAKEVMDHIQSSVNGIQEAAIYWKTGISHAVAQLKEMNIFDLNEPLAIRLLQPSIEYAAFIETTSKKLNNIGEDTIREKALLASLYMAESQFVGINDLLSTVISPEMEIIRPSPIRLLRLPRIQQRELLLGSEIRDVEDEEELTRLSPAAGTSTTARSVMYMVTGCNEEYLAAGKPEMFKFTIRFVESVADITWLLPKDRHSFADFVDCLYFIFYEGAGRDNLRYLKEHGGVLNHGDCNFIWCIKVLRNKWLRHDLEHGSPSDIKRSQEALLEQLYFLGLMQLPRSAADFRLLHRKLLDEAFAFMQRIWDRLPEKSQ